MKISFLKTSAFSVDSWSILQDYIFLVDYEQNIILGTRSYTTTIPSRIFKATYSIYKKAPGEFSVSGNTNLKKKNSA